MRTKLTKEQELALCNEYKDAAGFKDLTVKYSISTAQLYRILARHKVSTTRKLVDFSDEALFIERYTTLPKHELEQAYDTDYDNIKAKAFRLKIKRPRELVKYKPKIPPIFLRKEDWAGWDAHKLAMLKFKVFNHYRAAGFPYIKFTTEEKVKLFNKIKNYDTTSSIIDKAVAVQDSNFLPDSYFPHMYEVKCNDGLPSTMDVFLSDVMLKKVVDSRIRFAERIADNTIRRGLKYLGQAVSNFKPRSAKAVYEHYAGQDAVVWDMSAGWGGRLLGAMASNNISKYIGTDPNTKNTDGYNNIYNDFKDLTKCKVEFHCLGSEDYRPEPESLDLCFTSPPYFNTEVYSDEPTQSCIKYPDKTGWLNGYLGQTFKNAYLGLKPGKYMIINIADVQNYPELEEDTVKTALANGFTLVDTLQYRMGMTMFKKKEDGAFRYEPLFIFQKPAKL